MYACKRKTQKKNYKIVEKFLQFIYPKVSDIFMTFAIKAK